MNRAMLVLMVLAAAGCTNDSRPTPPVKNSAAENRPAEPANPPPVTTSAPAEPPVEPFEKPVRELYGQRFAVETVATGLSRPWAMDWLDDGRLVFTQLGGDLSIVESGSVRRLHHFDEVQPLGDGGLMGLAVSPTFSRDGLIYVSYTGLAGNERRNIIARCRLTPDASPDAKGDGPAVTQTRVLLNAVPAGEVHNGLPLRFGPDGMLWALTGDAGLGGRALPRTELGGKLLRMTPDGQVPRENPFQYSLVWTLGHRNGLGFDWHGVTGELYATEQSPTDMEFLINKNDGLYHIQKGKTYNASATNGAIRPRPESPIHVWEEPVGPAGAVFYRGDAFPAWRNRLFVATRSGQALYCVTIDDDPATVTDVIAILHKEFGRLRAVAVGPDGFVYIATANDQDDRIIRLVPE